MAASAFPDFAGPAPDVPDSPYLPLIDHLEDSEAAAEAHNKKYPNSPVTADTVVSPKGAVGRYQIKPSTAAGYGFDPDRLYDPD
jgi:hypothetical protein